MGNPVLCIFVRKDMASMNPGKAVAQGAHCATMFERHMSRVNVNTVVDATYREWCASTIDGFGTKFAFEINESDIHVLDDLAKNDFRFKNSVFDICIDPTYPVRDGKITHYISIQTACYVFLDADDLGVSPIKFFNEKGIKLVA